MERGCGEAWFRFDRRWRLRNPLRGCRRNGWSLSCRRWGWRGSCRLRLRTEHRQKLRVFQRIQCLHECLARHGQFLAVAQLVAVLRELIFGRQVIRQSERNGILAVRARGSITAPAGNQCTGLP